MTVETDRQLATAIESLAKSNLGTGGLLRELIASQNETNRALGRISAQNAGILEHLERGDVRHGDSERHIRVVKKVLDKHDERLAAIEEKLGVESPAADS